MGFKALNLGIRAIIFQNINIALCGVDGNLKNFFFFFLEILYFGLKLRKKFWRKPLRLDYAQNSDVNLYVIKYREITDKHR